MNQKEPDWVLFLFQLFENQRPRCQFRAMIFSKATFRIIQGIVFIINILAANPGLAQSPVVVLSKSYGNGTYEGWLKRQMPELKLVSLYHLPADSVRYWLHRADGVLMTGGEDIFPGRYGKEADTVLCGDMDLRRDSLEFQILDSAQLRKLPTFGICRGLQVMNIYSGGTLYLDLPSQLGSGNLHRTDQPVHHAVEVKKGSPLADWCGVNSGMVLSNHHQGIEKLGKGLVAQAFSSDGLTEAFIRTYGPFWAAVQWHPERMENGNPLSEGPVRRFVEEVRLFAQKRRK